MNAAHYKPGILLAAFGAGTEQGRRTFRAFDDAVRELFPDVPVRWAYTSGMLRNKLAGAGTKTDSVAKALDKMRFERFTHVAVQSMHVVPGSEFSDLEQEVLSRAGEASGFSAIALGAPLLAADEDIPAVAGAVMDHAPSRGVHDALVLMGHGTVHAADTKYDQLEHYLRSQSEGIYLATMDGARTLDHVLPELKARKVQRVFVMPLLAVAGHHVRRDMAGSHPLSWVSIIEAHGMTCVPVLAGLAEYAGFARIWGAHLKQCSSAIFLP